MKLVFTIIGSVFSLIGALFTILGLIFWRFIDQIKASPNSHGDVTLLPIVFGGMGVLFLLIGIGFLIALYVSAKRIKRLREEGKYIWGEVVNYYQNRNVRINGRHPFIVECQAVDPITGEYRIYESESIRECPEYLMGRQLKIYVDPVNPKIYFVEI